MSPILERIELLLLSAVSLKANKGKWSIIPPNSCPLLAPRNGIYIAAVLKKTLPPPRLKRILTKFLAYISNEFVIDQNL